MAAVTLGSVDLFVAAASARWVRLAPRGMVSGDALSSTLKEGNLIIGPLPAQIVSGTALDLKAAVNYPGRRNTIDEAGR